MRDKFKKFGGETIPDVIQYIKDYVEKDPTVTITVGCDSIQKRRKTFYAITIMFYNKDIKNGAHVIFYRESYKKIRDNQERLYKEAQYLYDVGSFLDKELSGFYNRLDLNDENYKKYKFHTLRCEGKYLDIESHREIGVIKNLTVTEKDRIEYKLVDLHVDFNPAKGNLTDRGGFKNKSYIAYKSYVPWLRSIGFRTWAKPISHAATTAADLLLKSL